MLVPHMLEPYDNGAEKIVLAELVQSEHSCFTDDVVRSLGELNSNLLQKLCMQPSGSSEELGTQAVPECDFSLEQFHLPLLSPVVYEDDYYFGTGD